MRSYWLDLFTGSTGQEFIDAGGAVSGFVNGAGGPSNTSSQAITSCAI
jgi:hypothetical protein